LFADNNFQRRAALTAQGMNIAGASLVIPNSASLSRCLTLIESVQNQKFSRHIPEASGSGKATRC
jgi:hypothetical protein